MGTEGEGLERPPLPTSKPSDMIYCPTLQTHSLIKQFNNTDSESTILSLEFSVQGKLLASLVYEIIFRLSFPLFKF